MALPFWVYWLCTLLLWSSIRFPSQKGYNIAHGYSLNGGDISYHEGGLQTSNQLDFGASLNTDIDSVGPGDEMQAQSFDSLQREPVHQENNMDTSLSEDMVQSEPDSGSDPDTFEEAPPVQKRYHDYRHPFGLLMKEHKQKKTMEGVTFPTMDDFKLFIETMKSSFLTPGSDVSGHFQTARDIMEIELDSKAQNADKESDDKEYGSSSAKEGETHDDVDENEVWTEPMNTVIEQGASYQMPTDGLAAPDSADSTLSHDFTSVYDNQDSGPGSAFYPRHHLAATEHVSSNYESSDTVGIPGGNPDIFTSIPDVRNVDVQPRSYKLPGSFFEEDLSLSGDEIASSSSHSQDYSYYSSKTSDVTPLTSEENNQQPKHTSYSKGYQKPADFELEDFQREELSRAIPANVLSAPKPRSSYGKSLYVTPRGQLHILDYQPKQREKPAPSFQAYQPTVGEESSNAVHPPESSGSVSSSSENLTPRSNSGYDITVKPSSYPHRVRVTRPFILTAQAKDEKSDLPRQNLVSLIQEPKQMTNNNPIPISGGLDSTQSGISSQAGVGHASFNSLSNLAPSLETPFSRFVGNEDMSRNLGIKNIISDRFPTGNIHGNLQTFIPPTKAHELPANEYGKPRKMVNWPLKPLSASKVPGPSFSGVFLRTGGNTKGLPLQTDMSAPPLNTYVVQSRNGYVRGKVSLSKTHYAPNQLDEGKTVVPHVKGSEEP